MAQTALKQRFAGDRLKQDLLTQIESGNLGVGDAVLPERKLASRYGIGYMTVRKAIAELEDQGILERCQGKGTFVRKGQVPLTAQEVVGLVMITTGHVYESFSSRIIRGLMTHDLFPLVVDIPHDSEIGFRRTRMLIEKQPPFLVFDIAVAPFQELLLSLLKEYKGQLIFVHGFDFKEEFPASYVLSDMYRGGMMVAEHLIDSGYRRIIHYTFMVENKKKNAPLMGEGIKAAIKNRGLPESMFSCWLEGEGEKAIEERLRKEKLPVALVGTSDYRLESIYKIAEKTGLRIPEDLGLVGWHNTPWCKTFHPHLTSVSIREDLMADKVIEVITDKTMQGKKILVPPELVIRDSTSRR